MLDHRRIAAPSGQSCRRVSSGGRLNSLAPHRTILLVLITVALASLENGYLSSKPCRMCTIGTPHRIAGLSHPMLTTSGSILKSHSHH
ncbi:hypothetical protein IG631_14517 [Alternaria alternata]|nr:hypothetical protein IG631_14517 [Alternaria alternata]